jgi:hypothetical protein
MNNEWYVEESSYPTPDLCCTEQSAESLQGPANPSCLASQLRELLGEGCELDASLLEESWRSGLPVGTTSYRRNRNRSTENDKGVTFAELNTAGSFFFSQESWLVGDCRGDLYPWHPMRPYAAASLLDPLEESARPEVDQNPEQEPKEYRRPVDDTETSGSMTCERACDLLGVSGESTVAQIRMAYRRMVSEWHPDRMERSGETVRAFATKQMAAINEAYHLLRALSSATVC